MVVSCEAWSGTAAVQILYADARCGSSAPSYKAAARAPTFPSAVAA